MSAATVSNTMARRAAPTAALALTLTLLGAACGYTKPPTGITPADPGHCVPVDVAAPVETASLLHDTAARFNQSTSSHLPDGGCAFVRVETVASAVALRELATNWPDTTQLGPAPVMWVPGSTMWSELLDARLAAQHRPPMAPAGTPFARSPLVVAMPVPMAQALGYPRRPITWSLFARLAGDPRGWGAYGHPEWGRFRLGKGNPNFSTAALDATVAADATSATGSDIRALEQAVVYYADSTNVYFDTWQRLAARTPALALTYLSAAVSDERSVVAFNEGRLQSDVSLTSREPGPRPLKLVALYPAGGSIESDNPMTVLDAPWASAARRAGANRFVTFAQQPPAQARVAAAGYHPGRGDLRSDILSPANGVDARVRPASVGPATPIAIVHALTLWQTRRRPGRVLVLFDVSDSMGDPAAADGSSKLTLAKSALGTALDQLAPGDDIGLRIFSTKLGGATPNWRDVVPTGPVVSRRRELTQAIGALVPLRGSPLYAATAGAYDTVSRSAESQHINGVIVLTDGYNEDDHDTNLDALLSRLRADPDVRVVTIAFGIQADVPTLAKIAQATNASTYVAELPGDLADAFARALGNF